MKRTFLLVLLVGCIASVNSYAATIITSRSNIRHQGHSLKIGVKGEFSEKLDAGEYTVTFDGEELKALQSGKTITITFSAATVNTKGFIVNGKTGTGVITANKDFKEAVFTIPAGGGTISGKIAPHFSDWQQHRD